MDKNVFDQAKCIRCYTCVEICPLGLIEVSEETHYPVLPEGSQARCVQCGHCEAVCPESGILVDGALLKKADAGLAGKFSAMTAEQFAAYCMRRRSIRHYKPEPVKTALLEKLFDIVRYAPSGVNRQPVKWVVVRTTDMVRHMALLTVEWMRQTRRANPAVAARFGMEHLIADWENGKDPICRNAPHLIMAYAHKDDKIASTDGVIALSHLELAAPALGLGACWAGYLNMALNMSPALKEAAGIPADQASLGAMMIGYPKYKYVRIPKRNHAAITWK